DASVPTFMVYQDALKVPHISGLNTYLQSEGLPTPFRERLTKHVDVRSALLALRRGHHLEAVAAAIMNATCNYGEATRGAGDQGIDAIGWKELLRINSAFCYVGVDKRDVLPGEQVFLFASS